jgi:ABC-type glutathione transport system ATPase component
MLLTVKDLYKTFPSGVKALDGISFDMVCGEHIGIVGESGCGKTTLARMIMGLLKADKGAVSFDGDLQRQARMVFQDPFASLDPRYSVRMILKEALTLEGRMSAGEEFTRMRKVLDLVRLPGDILMRYPHEFSGGERQRIAIARALMTAPSLLILDEAVSSLDVLVQQEILGVLEELRSRIDVTYLFITHNLRVVRRLTDRIIVMQQGRIVESGACEDVFGRPVQLYTQALLKAAFNYEVAA